MPAKAPVAAQAQDYQSQLKASAELFKQGMAQGGAIGNSSGVSYISPVSGSQSYSANTLTVVR